MNVKPNSINPAHRAHLLNFSKVAVVAGSLTVGALALAYDQNATEYKPPVLVPNVAPSEYGVIDMKLDSENSGNAIIMLDSFRVQVGFDFEAHNDNYGVTGSDFTAIDITNLSVDSITDINGKSYRDFTDYNDHRNINQLIISYIEKNNLVEAV